MVLWFFLTFPTDFQCSLYADRPFVSVLLSIISCNIMKGKPFFFFGVGCKLLNLKFDFLTLSMLLERRYKISAAALSSKS